MSNVSELLINLVISEGPKRLTDPDQKGVQPVAPLIRRSTSSQVLSGERQSLNG